MTGCEIDRIEWEHSILRDVDEIRAGRQQTYTLEEIERELDLGPPHR